MKKIKRVFTIAILIGVLVGVLGVIGHFAGAAKWFRGGEREPISRKYLHKTAAEWIVSLNSKNEGERLNAEIALSSQDLRDDALPLLATALHEPDSCHRVAEVLARIGETAVPTLIEGLRSDNQTVRFQAARAITGIGPNAEMAVDELIAVLNCNDGFSDSMAASALGAIGDKAQSAIPHLIAKMKLRDRTPLNRPLPFEVPSEKNLEATLKKAGVLILTTKSEESLKKMGPRVARALIYVLDDTDASLPLRRDSVIIIGSLKSMDPEVEMALLFALSDSAAEVRALAARYLPARCGASPGALRGLRFALKDSEARVRHAAASALGDYGDRYGERVQAVVPDLIPMINDEGRFREDGSEEDYLVKEAVWAAVWKINRVAAESGCARASRGSRRQTSPMIERNASRAVAKPWQTPVVATPYLTVRSIS